MVEIHRIGSLVDRLRSLVVLFEELYGCEDSIREIKRTAPQSFGLIKSSLQYEIVMRIASLLDPAKTMGSDNLTFDRLHARFDETLRSESKSYFLLECEDGNLHEEIAKKYKIFRDFEEQIIELHYLYKSTNIKNYRNKLGAHLDVTYSTGKKQLNIEIDDSSLANILNKMISILYLAGQLYEGPDKDQFLHRNMEMPMSAGGKELLKKLRNI
ncbi:hypothetical protein ACJJH9_12585 [Microbulbifer sp. DLAB2-AF]|uniref:AbiU2 domain-containing protein n=1 Tax=Microbulbifer sp. DLAB2-AF TaxID=3243395 RepID=UPI00403982D6